MSVNAVGMFYAKLASDQMLNRTFARATAEFTMKFAAERGYLFTEHDMQIYNDNLHGLAKQFGKDVKQLHEHHVGNVAKAAAQAVGKVAGKAGGKAGAKSSGLSPEFVKAAMSVAGAKDAMGNMEMNQILGRIGQIMGSLGAKRQKSG